MLKYIFIAFHFISFAIFRAPPPTPFSLEDLAKKNSKFHSPTLTMKNV